MAGRTALVFTTTTVLLLVWLLAGCAAGRSEDGQQEAQHQEDAEREADSGDVSNGRIVFLGEGDGDSGDIYVMNADGSNERNLTHTTTQEYEPLLSPDGRKIAFMRGYYDVYVMNADGSDLTHLTDNTLAFSRLAWSPDGKKIAYTRSDGAGIGDIYVINADGSDQTKLISTPEELDVYVGTPLWSPDGQKIAFQRYTEKVTDTDSSIPASAPVEEMSGIYVMNADGTDLHKLPNTSGSSGSPAWSPDGKKIAFSHGGDVYVMNSDGTGRTNLTNSPPNELNPAWSPDGEKIAFMVEDSNDSGIHVIYVMNSDGTGRTRLTDADSGPLWSPDGQKIAFMVGGKFVVAPKNFCVINAGGTDRTCLAKGAILDPNSFPTIPIGTWARG